MIFTFLLIGIYLGYVEFYIQKDFTGFGVNFKALVEVIVNYLKGGK